MMKKFIIRILTRLGIIQRWDPCGPIAHGKLELSREWESPETILPMPKDGKIIKIEYQIPAPIKSDLEFINAKPWMAEQLAQRMCDRYSAQPEVSQTIKIDGELTRKSLAKFAEAMNAASASAIQAAHGLMSINEIRAHEGLPPIQHDAAGQLIDVSSHGPTGMRKYIPGLAEAKTPRECGRCGAKKQIGRCDYCGSLDNGTCAQCGAPPGSGKYCIQCGSIQGRNRS